MTALQVPAPIHALARRVHEAGGRAYLVGGCVRDHLLGHPVKDWDVEVFGVAPDRLANLLRRTGAVNAVGKSFGVYKWKPGGTGEEIDVSIPRRDSKVGPGHRGIQVDGDPDMPVAEAARRRDLTINAILWDLTDDVVVDPWGGQQDLARRVLRAVDADTFLEDPLRALRVAQFAGRLAFAVDPALVALCRTAPLDELPPERIQGEWGKLLLKAPAPSLGFAFARAAAILERVFPEVAALDADAPLDRLAAGPRATMTPEGRAWALMLAGWLHAADAVAIEHTLDRMWMHTVRGYPVRERVQAAVAARTLPMATDAELRRLSVRAEPVLVLSLRAATAGEDTRAAAARAEALGILETPPPPLLRGRDLKGLVDPGPRMGEILHDVYEHQLDGAVTTHEDALALAAALART